LNATLRSDGTLLLRGTTSGELSASGPVTIKGALVNIN
jgi:hypothetical protein